MIMSTTPSTSKTAHRKLGGELELDEELEELETEEELELLEEELLELAYGHTSCPVVSVWQ
jgi:hypothetical protein